MNEYLKEDSTILDIKRQQSGLKKGEQLLKPNIVGDLLNTNQSKDFAPTLKPYPLDRFDRISTDAFIQVLNLRKILDIAKSNPAISNKYSQHMEQAGKLLEKVGEDLVEINRIVDIIH